MSICAEQQFAYLFTYESLLDKALERKTLTNLEDTRLASRGEFREFHYDAVRYRAALVHAGRKDTTS